jgi:hypothetical protein
MTITEWDRSAKPVRSPLSLAATLVTAARDDAAAVSSEFAAVPMPS